MNTDKKEIKKLDIYSKGLISKEINIPITCIGNNIKQTLEQTIINEIEGKCIVEGFIKPNSVKLINYSSGIVQGLFIKFILIIECYICCPVEGMLIECIAKNITKAGIRAETIDIPSPVIIFITRDHHHKQKYYSTIKQEDKINIRVIGQRFELNDKYISIIAELIEPREFRKEREKAEKYNSKKNKKQKNKSDEENINIDEPSIIENSKGKGNINNYESDSDSNSDIDFNYKNKIIKNTFNTNKMYDYDNNDNNNDYIEDIENDDDDDDDDNVYSIKNINNSESESESDSDSESELDSELQYNEDKI